MIIMGHYTDIMVKLAEKFEKKSQTNNWSSNNQPLISALQTMLNITQYNATITKDNYV